MADSGDCPVSAEPKPGAVENKHRWEVKMIGRIIVLMLASLIWLAVLPPAQVGATPITGDPPTFSCDTAKNPPCPGALLIKKDNDTAATLEEDTGKNVFRPFQNNQLATGVLVLCEDGTKKCDNSTKSNWSDIVVFACAANAPFMCTVSLFSDIEPGERENGVEEDLTKTMVNGTLFQPEPNGTKENTTQKFVYETTGPGGTFTYTIFSDVAAPEPSSIAILAAGIFGAAVFKLSGSRLTLRSACAPTGKAGGC